MSETPNNLDPKESTEAKLCAYLEGELPPAERAEIETYLTNNPQHRQLLSELAKTREFVRALPREAAPAEIAELFQERLERSLLLDTDAAGNTAPIARMNRWPHIALLAAMVCLAGGLAVVIYSVLPGHGPAPTQYSIAPQPQPMATATAPATASPSAAPTADVVAKSSGPAEKAGTPTVAGEMDLAKSGPAPVPAAAPTVVATATPPATESDHRMERFGGGFEAGRVRVEKSFGGAGGGGAGFGVVSPSAISGSSSAMLGVIDTKAVNERLARSNSTLQKLGAAKNNTVYVVVSANDTNAAATQVRDFFTMNNIAYQPLATDDAAVSTGVDSIALKSDATVSKQAALGMAKEEMSKKAAFDSTDGAMRKDAGPDRRLYDKDYAQKISPRAGNGQDMQNAEVAANAPPAAPQSQGQSSTPTAGAPAGQAGDNLAQQQQAANYSTSNNYVQAGNRNASSNVSSSYREQQVPQQPTAQAQPVQLNAAVNPADLTANSNEPVALGDSGDAWVATGLTRREAEQLSATLSTQGTGQIAAVVTPTAGGIVATGNAFNFNGTINAAATTLPATMPAQQQESQPLLFAKEPASQSATAPSGGAAADNVAVNDQLTVTVPQLVGPGVEKTNTVKVAEDGTINLPMLEPVPAAGRTPAELERQIGKQYADAKLIANPTVTVTRAPATPATQPVMDLPTTTQPSAVAQAVEEPQRAPATQPVLDAAERVDVVVLLQKNRIAVTPTTEPAPAATQPVEAK
ncbi:MAG TPA: polysaccharide biosynthesis/export family protein [Tepidisphaeraceae bacterium]|nr:polysaccharide biosynthesis/export family protein [Tepidisphaeraceae bacterium]